MSDNSTFQKQSAAASSDSTVRTVLTALIVLGGVMHVLTSLIRVFPHLETIGTEMTPTVVSEIVRLVFVVWAMEFVLLQMQRALYLMSVIGICSALVSMLWRMGWNSHPQTS